MALPMKLYDSLEQNNLGMYYINMNDWITIQMD